MSNPARDLAQAAGRLATNPLVSLELAAAFRRRRFVVVFTIYLLIVVAILISVVTSLAASRPAVIGQSVFLVFLWAIGAPAALLFPAFSCTTIVDERVNKSLDLLLVTRMEPWEVYAGKLAGSIVYSAIFLVATLPIVALSFLFGGVEPGAIVGAYALAMTYALVLCAIGTYASATATTTLRAVVIAYLLCGLVAPFFFWGTVPVALRWIGTSLADMPAQFIAEVDRWFTNFGELIYLGTAFFTAVIVGFFTLAGTNRLKPPAYDRSTPMRAFALFFVAGAATLYVAILRRMLSIAPVQSSTGTNAELVWVTATPIIIAAIVLFIPTLVFATEPTDLSRRIQGEVAARKPFSPLRLLAPGPARGALFAILLSAATLLGLAAEAIWGIDASAPGVRNLRANAQMELAVMLLAFLVFLAATGRLLAEHAKGPLAPRLAVAGLAVVLLLGPLLAMIGEEERLWRMPTRPTRGTPPPPEGIPTSVARGYILSPVICAFAAMTVEKDVYKRPRFYLNPGETDEGAAIPVHRASAVLYAALAALAWALGVARARRRAEEEGVKP